MRGPAGDPPLAKAPCLLGPPRLAQHLATGLARALGEPRYEVLAADVAQRIGQLVKPPARPQPFPNSVRLLTPLEAGPLGR